MDILIKNIELPPEGKQICLWVMHNGTVWHEVARDMIPTEMEAIPVPEHGDLVNIGDVYEAINREIVPKGIFLSDFYKAFADIPVVLERTT